MLIHGACAASGGECDPERFKDLWVKHREWVFEPISYTSVEELVQGLSEGIIEPALERFDKLMKMKAEELPVRRMADIIKRGSEALIAAPLLYPSSPKFAP